MSDEALDRCQEAIGYQFQDRSLLTAALTHASIASNRLESNERLEFLGDSILGMVVCQYLYDHYPNYLEGELTKVKSAVVSRKTCAEISDKLNLSEYLFLGNGIASRAKLPTSLPAAVLESLIAAIAIDGGIDRARAFILENTVPHIELAVASENQENYKSQLQQYAQKELGATPAYEFLDEKGPDHSKCFEVAVRLRNQRFRSAWGPNKKEAEQKAALNALVELKVLPADSETA
ncbi:MAG: ribonuclease III [Phycisphaerae bacterium]|nr:ribonuclease III [Phycisphaerae bacterium]